MYCFRRVQETQWGLTIDRSVSELASIDLLLEEVVNVGEATVPGLRQEEEDPNDPEEAETKVEQASLGTPVPGVAGVLEHTGVELLDHDAAADVDGTAEHNGLGTDTGRGNFSDDDVGGGAERDLEHALHDDEEDGSGDGVRLDRRCKSQDTDDQHAEADTRRTVQVESAASNLDHEHDGNGGGKNVDGLDTHVVVEGIGIAHANGCEQNSGVLGDGLAVEHLDDPGHADNDGTTEVSAAEAVPVAGVLRLDLLHLVGVLHESEGLGHGLISVETLAREATQALLGIFDTVAADEVPGRLGSQAADDEQRRDPYPLQTVGDAPARVAQNVDGAAEDTGGEEAAGTPAHGHPGGQVATHGGGADLGGVGGGEGLEDTPWDTADDVSGQKHLDARGEEEDEDGGAHEDNGELGSDVCQLGIAVGSHPVRIYVQCRPSWIRSETAGNR